MPENNATKSQVTMGCHMHIYPQNCPFPPMIITPSNTHLPRPTPLTTPNGICGSASNQLFCLSTLSGLTDRQTDRQTD